MQKIDLLLFSRWLIPIDPEGVVWENHALAIQNGKIFDILPAEEAKKKYLADDFIEMQHHIVMPGLVNAHTHSPMVLLRGLGDDFPLMDWLNKVIWPAEKQYLSEQFVQDGTELAIAEMIRSGTTCFNEHYFFPETIAKVVEQVGIRSRIGVLLIETQSLCSSTIETTLKKGIELFEKYKTHDLISIGVAPHASYTLSEHALRLLQLTLRKNALPLHIHMHETVQEIELDIRQYGKRPLTRFYEADLLSNQCQLVHMTQVNREDIAILKATKASVIHCPASNLKLASGICPVNDLLKEHVNIGLGTDGAASNNTLDLFQTMYLASLIGKLKAEDATAVSAMESLKLATIGGAKALGLAHEIGSLNIGKSADIIAIDMKSLNSQPIYHPISQLVYATQGRQVTDVWVAGKRLLKEGILTFLDETALLSKIKQWENKIRTCSKF